MARPLVTMLREAAMIQSSKILNEKQKAHALSMLQVEIDAATGQGSLELPASSGGVPPAPQETSETTRKAPRAS